MKQLSQKLKSGNMQVLEVPMPSLLPGTVLVKNYYSVVSAGTEGSTVKTARKGLIGKAKERPQQVKQVLDVLKSQGPVQTYRTVMKKLDAHSPLGYSCVGEVIDIGSHPGEMRSAVVNEFHRAGRAEVTPVESPSGYSWRSNSTGQGGRRSEFKIGDLVACGGSTASHAEVVAVPVNLCVKIAQSSKLKAESHLRMAAYNTLGAIAMQGVRQADLRLGESCAVIGLGLLGQLACLMLRASGVGVFGIDVNPWVVEIGREKCCDIAWERKTPGLTEQIFRLTHGLGVDAVIIAAASSSLDPINFAGEISRKRGRVVVLGAVPTGFDREPHYYKKELEVRMSCSYGPGRYDPAYEEKGMDYPPAYVRWTEKRNMQAFQELIASGKIDVSYLTTHVFKLEDSPKAYDMIVEKKEPYLGILIKYDPHPSGMDSVLHGAGITQTKITVKPSAISHQPSAISIGFIGAGSYAQSYLLPNIPKGDDVVLKGVMTNSGTSSKRVAEKFGFEFCTGNEDDILGDGGVNTVFIATRHDSHAYYVTKAIEAGKHVFVEKPLCLTVEELEEIRLAADERRLTQMFSSAVSAEENESSLTRNKKRLRESDPKQNGADHQLPIANNESQITSNGVPLLMVGYNRRFSPLGVLLKEKMRTGPMAMLYRINAGRIPADSWIQDKDLGGGRIIGEVCHFVDFLIFLNGSLPVEVFATPLPDPANLQDTAAIQLRFENGAVGTISYFANGSKSLPKEYIEVYKDGMTGIIRDFREMEVYGEARTFRKKLWSQDKGQKNMVQAFIGAIRDGNPSPIAFHEIHAVTLATFKILESLRTRQTVHI